MKEQIKANAFTAFLKKLARPQMRRKLYSSLITVAVIVGLVLVNVAATALAERYPITLDLTADGDYSLTTLKSEHEDFIRGIQYDVKITMCMNEGDLNSGLYSYYLQNLYSYEDSTNGKYYEQMVALIKQYPKLNPHISVRFLSPLETAFTEVTQTYPNEEFQYGDVLLECSFENKEDKEINRYRILNVDDLYKAEDQSGGMYEMYYGYTVYTVNGSTLEPSVTQALYAVTQEASLQGLVYTGKNCDASEALVKLLERNNYEFSGISNLLTETIAEDVQFLIINAPESDFTNEEIATIQKFMESDEEKRQKTLVYIPHESIVLENMEAFLEEWDIQLSDALIYADDDQYYSNFEAAYGSDFAHLMPFITASNEGSVYDVAVDANDTFAPSYYRAINANKTSEEDESIVSMLKYKGEVVGKPVSEISSDSDWKPGEGEHYTNPAAVCVATEYKATNATLEQESIYMYSTVLCIGSQTFVSDAALTSTAYANGDYTVKLFNNLAAMDESDIPDITFSTKVIKTDSFADELSDSIAPSVVSTIFFIIVPLALIITCVVVCVWRKRR